MFSSVTDSITSVELDELRDMFSELEPVIYNYITDKYPNSSSEIYFEPGLFSGDVSVLLTPDGPVIQLSVGEKLSSDPEIKICKLADDIEPGDPEADPYTDDEAKFVASIPGDVSIRFSGAGDSGSFDEILISAPDTDTELNVDSETRGKIEDFIYDFINSMHTDWWNNDGGSGLVNFDFKTKTLYIEIIGNYTEYNNHDINSEQIINLIEKC